MKCGLCDAHTHLNMEPLYQDVSQYIKQFENVGGDLLVNIGTNIDYSARAIDISHSYTHLGCALYATVGYHPVNIQTGELYGDKTIEEEILQLEEMYTSNASVVVGIGECGIDLHHSGQEMLELQEAYFRKQCELAQKLQLPVIVHSREAFSETYRIMNTFPKLKFYFHSWTYPYHDLEELLKNSSNVRIGFNGIVTFKNAKQVHQALEVCPLDKIVIETDAPYLSPDPHRGHTNSPDYIVYIYESIARQKKVDLGLLQRVVHENVRNLYNII